MIVSGPSRPAHPRAVVTENAAARLRRRPIAACVASPQQPPAHTHARAGLRWGETRKCWPSDGRDSRLRILAISRLRVRIVQHESAVPLGKGSRWRHSFVLETLSLASEPDAFGRSSASLLSDSPRFFSSRVAQSTHGCPPGIFEARQPDATRLVVQPHPSRDVVGERLAVQDGLSRTCGDHVYKLQKLTLVHQTFLRHTQTCGALHAAAGGPRLRC